MVAGGGPGSGLRRRADVPKNFYAKTALGWEAANKSIYFLLKLSAYMGAALPELPLRLIFLHGPNFSTRQLDLS